MSHGLRPVPAARLVLLTAIVLLPGRCLGGNPPPLPDSRLGLRQAPLLLLSRPDVRADVGLSPEQTADAERALTELYVRAAALKGTTGPASDAERRAIDEAQDLWLRSRLSEAQRKRLIQIDLQWEGPSALISRPVVADHLGLTSEQRTRLSEAIAERNRRRAEGGDLRESEYQLALKAKALLTPEQRERWWAMLGHRFTPQLAGAPARAPH